MATTMASSRSSSVFGISAPRAAPRARCSTVRASGATGATMMKKGIHPEWHANAPVICNGVEVMSVGGCLPQYNVDIYSGNHPFYQGKSSNMVMDDGVLNKFKKRFADMGAMGEVGAAASIPGKAIDESVPKSKDKKKGKKK